jgi:RNA recognition motif-containing protein
MLYFNKCNFFLYISTYKENELTIRDQNSSNAAKVAEKKAVLGRERKAADQQSGKPAWKDQGKGVVYLSHIPKGFYEEEMNSYFSQFGRVTRLNLVRSKKVC